MSAVMGALYKGTSFTTRSHISEVQRHNQHQNKKTKERRRENDEKRYNTFFSRENNVFRHYLDCIFCIVYRKMAGRNSKRMRQEKT